MHILWMLIVGVIAGGLAKLAMPGKDPGGIVVTMVLGIAGSFLAGFFGRMIGHYQAGSRPGIIASTIGAFVILGLYRVYLGARHRAPLQGNPRGLTH
jgi:uncharacterized membrane protein YeaQ/YmgE (transglycosylase-associated protein family)